MSENKGPIGSDVDEHLQEELKDPEFAVEFEKAKHKPYTEKNVNNFLKENSDLMDDLSKTQKEDISLDKQLEQLGDRGRTAEQWRAMYDKLQKESSADRAVLKAVGKDYNRVIIECDALKVELDKLKNNRTLVFFTELEKRCADQTKFITELKVQLEKAENYIYNPANWTDLAKENDQLKAKVKELEEYKFMYEDLCK